MQPQCLASLCISDDSFSCAGSQVGIGIALSLRTERALLDWIPINTCLCSLIRRYYAQTEVSPVHRICVCTHWLQFFWDQKWVLLGLVRITPEFESNESDDSSAQQSYLAVTERCIRDPNFCPSRWHLQRSWPQTTSGKQIFTIKNDVV